MQNVMSKPFPANKRSHHHADLVAFIKNHAQLCFLKNGQGLSQSLPAQEPHPNIMQSKESLPSLDVLSFEHMK